MTDYVEESAKAFRALVSTFSGEMKLSNRTDTTEVEITASGDGGKILFTVAWWPDGNIIVKPAGGGSIIFSPNQHETNLLRTTSVEDVLSRYAS